MTEGPTYRGTDAVRLLARFSGARHCGHSQPSRALELDPYLRGGYTPHRKTAGNGPETSPEKSETPFW